MIKIRNIQLSYVDYLKMVLLCIHYVRKS
ncbi:hypothetical protein TRIP_E230100 [uncultured Spirochaetota bacterium]|nr:hypothetical protein TRIP_E230100 [uncultured Spirochaetota bacterium]